MSGGFNNIAKGIRPGYMDEDTENDPLELTPNEEANEVGSELPFQQEGDNFTITEDEDGGVTIEFGDPNVEAPILGFGDNLADHIDETELARISSDLIAAIEADKLSRADWEEAYEKGLTLLGLTAEERNEPFKGASGVVHPILNEAVVQFQSQAYKELLPAGGPARTTIVGGESREKDDQSNRVKDFLNYLITEEMVEYDTDFDQMLYHLGFGGSTFKKVYFDQGLERVTSPFILPKDLIVPYSARDLYTAERVTHVVPMSENELRKLQVSGFYRDVDIKPTTPVKDVIKEAEDKIKGIQPNATVIEDFELYECHCNLDIEGFEDVYPEGHENAGEPTGIKHPYIVTIEKSSGEVLAVRRNYAENDKKCRKKQYFVHYKFLPGFGFYGLGLVHLLGNIARAGTGALRQLIDAGTLANLSGGFKAKGMRVANEKEPIQPGEWRDVDAPNGDLRAALMPLPYKEPSPTLFNLLGFLIEAAEKFIGTTDLGMGDSNQEMPVGSVIALLERGSRVLSSVHKRLHYAQKLELKLIAEVVAEAMPDEYPYEVKGQQKTIKKADFDGRIDVIPVSDPNIFSMTQRIALAQEQMKMAQASPTLHNMYEANRRMYVALGVTDIDEILPKPPEPVPMTPAAEHGLVIAVNSTAPLKAFIGQDHMLHMQQHLAFLKAPVLQQIPQATVALTQHCLEHITMMCRERVAQSNPQWMQMLQKQQPITDLNFTNQVAQLEAQVMQQFLQALIPQQPQQDPLVALKARELDIKEKVEGEKIRQGDEKIDLQEQKLEQDRELKEKQLHQQQISSTLDRQDKQKEARFKGSMDIVKTHATHQQKERQFAVTAQQKDRQFSAGLAHKERTNQSNNELKKEMAAKKPEKPSKPKKPGEK